MALKTEKLSGAKPAVAKVTQAAKESAEVVSGIKGDDEGVGRLSSSLALVAVLGDPSDPDVVTIRDAKGNKERDDKKPRIVGYVFKNVGKEPITYITSPLAQDWTRKDRMSNVKDDRKQAVLKPGETVYLTHFETAVIMSRPEINLMATGGDVHATGVFSPRSRKASSVETSDEKDVSFQLRVTSGSIRDMKYINVLEFDEKDSETGGKVRTNHRILPQFADKFAPIAENRGRRPRVGTGAPRQTHAVYNPLAASFLASITKGK